jgi:hypothetical protein
VRSASELDEFNRILSNQKLVELARKVDQEAISNKYNILDG